MPSPVYTAGRKAQPARQSGIPTRPRRGAAGRVLVADPCPDTVETTAWLLRRWRYDVETATSGPAPWERRSRPDRA